MRPAGWRTRATTPRPGNQDPATPWPDSVVLAAAIAAATSELRIALAAIIAPLRHPLLLAKQLATLDLLAEGRLVVQPDGQLGRRGVRRPGRGVHPPGCDPGRAARGDARRLDARRPRRSAGEHFRFADVYLRAEAAPPGRPGDVVRRPGAASGSSAGGSSATGTASTPSERPPTPIWSAWPGRWPQAGRDVAELEIVGGIRGRFSGATDVADLDEALADIPHLIERGFTSICFKPSMFTDDRDAVPDICRRVVGSLAASS